MKEAFCLQRGKSVSLQKWCEEPSVSKMVFISKKFASELKLYSIVIQSSSLLSNQMKNFPHIQMKKFSSYSIMEFTIYQKIQTQFKQRTSRKIQILKYYQVLLGCFLLNLHNLVTDLWIQEHFFSIYFQLNHNLPFSISDSFRKLAYFQTVKQKYASGCTTANHLVEYTENRSKGVIQKNNYQRVLMFNKWNIFLLYANEISEEDHKFSSEFVTLEDSQVSCRTHFLGMHTVYDIENITKAIEKCLFDSWLSPENGGAPITANTMEFRSFYRRNEMIGKFMLLAVLVT